MLSRRAVSSASAARSDWVRRGASEPELPGAPAAMSRMRSIIEYAASPGQLVLPTSRCAKTIGNRTSSPSAYGVNSVPSEYMVV
ncbi:Uncharacterised protein [Mycobacteroides abscessus subsp. abscessus]|nr:Uncharacterised protein [Mycobacteroides abscessus subsp. abscessus]